MGNAFASVGGLETQGGNKIQNEGGGILNGGTHSLDGYTTGIDGTVIVNNMQPAILKTIGLQKSFSGKPEWIRIQMYLASI